MATKPLRVSTEYKHCVLCDQPMVGILDYQTATNRIYCEECEDTSEKEEK